MIESIHSTNFQALLDQCGLTILTTTYQAGKVIVIRVDDGVLNTHFRDADKPMGLYADRERLLIGSKNEIIEYRNMPVLSGALTPKDRHDACYVPRRRYTTGNVDIHELAMGKGGINFINTRFSAVCGLDEVNSFAPLWLPPFISRLAAEDRCHLNGFCHENGELRYATALGATDSARGWVAGKAQGGVLIDCRSGAKVLEGLAMPHSPRLYQGRLWLLESGTGAFGFVNREGRFETVARVPGFTRGLDFFGNLAFIGLSRLRGSATLRGIPLEENCAEPRAGIWVVDIRTGQTVAFVQFETGVEEIFAVALLPGIRFPEILDLADPLIDGAYTLDRKFLV